MTTLKKYDLAGTDKGEVVIEEELLKKTANPQVIKDYLVALRANRRQWSASTQTRAEVSHSKKKPFAQKGTGNARQGFLGSPQFRGGGRSHGPRPKFNQRVKINKKEKRSVISSQISGAIRSSRARVLVYEALKRPNTKTLAEFLKAIDLQGKRVLFLAGLGNIDCTTLSKSLKNIPKVQFARISNVNGYDFALNQEIVFLDSVVDDVKKILGVAKS